MQLNNFFEYEVAISFAGEQRYAAEAIAKLLKAAGVTVFYDKDEKADLWGKDLYVHLSDVYRLSSIESMRRLYLSPVPLYVSLVQ
jgi:hypothetical protein